MRIMLFLVAAALFVQTLPSVAQSAAFTYQGRLDSGGTSANGLYDFQFTLFDVPAGGSAISGTVTNEATSVSNGAFSVVLNFGSAPFDGAARWIDIGVRTNGGGTFSMLSPRHPITAAPYAITAARFSGIVPNSGIGGAYSNAVTFNNAANQFTGSFTGDGGALSNVNATTFGGLGADRFWKLGGNGGTIPGSDFLGTTDYQPFELKVANDRVFRFEPAPEVPNVIGGSRSNAVNAGVRGATIAGGGLPLYPHNVSADYGTVGGGTFHIVSGPWGTIAGGRDNRVHGESATVAGGMRNNIGSNAFVATIGGGIVNSIGTNANGATIGGGGANIVGPVANYATISGGNGNQIGSNAIWSVVGGGADNTVSNFAHRATIAGGSFNSIESGAHAATIGGGDDHRIEVGALWSTISGGVLNVIRSNAVEATIGGGERNQIAAANGTISGGTQNRAEGGPAPTVGGGDRNVAGGHYTTVGGGRLNTAIGFTSTIGGGGSNSIETNADHATISGGLVNRIERGSFRGVVAGGQTNVIGSNTFAGTISGGYSNAVLSGGSYGTIAGGEQNLAGAYAFAAGRRAKATHLGAFVWADTSSADFPSTAANQFSVRASGGVRFVTSGSGMTVDGLPVLAGAVSSGQIADGASLTELLDDDGSGSGLNTDLLDGLDSTAFAPASHNHFGESWIGAANTGLHVTTTNSAFSFVTGIVGRQGAGVGFPFGTPTGVWGDSQTGNGVLGSTAAAHEYGVVGRHVHSNGLGSGVFGSTSSTAGRGVTGTAGATSGPGIGVFGYVHSPLGIGVYGKHETTAGTAAGVQGDTDSTASSAVGVLGRVTSTAPGGFSAGVRGINNGTGGSGIGVYGSHEGAGWGVLGTAVSGTGVRGLSASGPGVVAITSTGNPFEAFSNGGSDREFYISSTGSVFADGPYSGAGADFAELLPAKEGSEPGDVLVVDEDGQMTRSTEAAQENVVGVYSTQPGFLGGADENGNNAGKVPLAVMGVVPVKVTGENGPIKPGNLLVTSSTPGHAMKAGSDARVGTIIGKALAPFNGGSGVIRMLVVLQ